MSQAELFPMTEEERIARIRSLLAKDEEKAKTKRDTALAALDEATESWTTASAMLTTFDEMTGVVAAARAAYATPEGVDPVTGEVAQVDSPAHVASSLEGPESSTPVVVVLWPGDPEPHVTVLGEHTMYLELIADYTSAVDYSGPIDDFVVVGEDDSTERRDSETIDPDDYGKRLMVCRNERKAAETAS